MPLPYRRATMNRTSGHSSAHQSAPDAVWEQILPAIPDRINDLGDGIYEALWWRPYPVMDIEILKRDECVDLLGPAFEPEQLPGGLGVQFRLRGP